MKASIIISADDGSTNLWRTLDSIRRLTDGPEYDVLVADSSANGEALRFLNIEQAGGSWDWIQRVDTRSCATLGAALSAAARHSSADVLVFLNAQVAVQSGWLSTLCRSLEENGFERAVVPRDCPIDQIRWIAGPSTHAVASLDESLWYHRVVFTEQDGVVVTASGSCIALHRDVFMRVGGFDRGLLSGKTEFIELVFRLAAAGVLTHLQADSEVGCLSIRSFGDRNDPDVVRDRLRIAHAYLSEEAYTRLIKTVSKGHGSGGLRLKIGPEPDDGGPGGKLPQDFVRAHLPAFGDGALVSGAGDPSPQTGVKGQLLLEFDGAIISLTSDSTHVADRISEGFQHFVTRASAKAHADVVVSRGHSGFTVTVNEVEVQTVPEERTASRVVREQIIRTFARLRTSYRWFHAGAVGRADQGILIVGPHGSGKSSLVQAFCERGWSYYSDDIVPLDPVRRQLLPFPTIPFVRVPRGEPEERKFSFKNIELDPESLAKTPVALSVLISPNRVGKGGVVVEAGSRSGAVLELTHRALRRLRDPVAVLEEFARIVDRISVIRVTYDDGNLAVAAVESFLTQSK